MTIINRHDVIALMFGLEGVIARLKGGLALQFLLNFVIRVHFTVRCLFVTDDDDPANERKATSSKFHI